MAEWWSAFSESNSWHIYKTFLLFVDLQNVILLGAILICVNQLGVVLMCVIVLSVVLMCVIHMGVFLMCVICQCVLPVECHLQNVILMGVIHSLSFWHLLFSLNAILLDVIVQYFILLQVILLNVFPLNRIFWMAFCWVWRLSYFFKGHTVECHSAEWHCVVCLCSECNDECNSV